MSLAERRTSFRSLSSVAKSRSRLMHPVHAHSEAQQLTPERQRPKRGVLHSLAGLVGLDAADVTTRRAERRTYLVVER